ncbi:MAG TPA: HlyD family secretion protein [Gemmatimonadaceae bacterium]|nr:HlyD family secretion protein [Gemmatimonadaceae bacterium]
MATSPNTSDLDATPTAGSSRRRILIPILIVAALAGLGWAFNAWRYARVHESTDDAQVDGDMTPVLAKVGGYVQRLTIDENVHVAGDSLLVQIDPAEYQARLAQAEADLAAARAAVSGPQGEGQAQAMVQAASSQRASLQAQIGAARANLTKANADLARARELVAKQIVSKQQLDAAQAAADAAAATLQALQRQQSAAGSNITAAQAGVRLAQARLAAAQAAVENAKLQLSYTRVTAPMAGLVSRKQVEIGQLVQPGQPLLTIVADTGVWVTANFKETQLSDILVGQPVDIDVDAYPGCDVKGKVESLSAATGAKFALLPPDNATGNFTKVVQRVPVRIAVTRGCGPDHPLRPGMSVVAHVVTQ